MMSNLKPCLRRMREAARDVRRLHVAVGHLDPPERVADRARCGRARPRRRAACRRCRWSGSTFFSCSTLLCLRLCRRAAGAVSGSLVRKTAVPLTRCGGLFSSMLTSSMRGTSALRVFSNRMRVPFTQVSMTMKNTPAMQERNVAAVEDLQQVRRQEGEVDERSGTMMSAVLSGPQPQLRLDHDAGEQGRHRPWCRTRRCRRRWPGCSTSRRASTSTITTMQQERSSRAAGRSGPDAFPR